MVRTFPARGRVIEVKKGHFWEVLKLLLSKNFRGRLEIRKDLLKCYVEIVDGNIVGLIVKSLKEEIKGMDAFKKLGDLLKEEGVYKIIELTKHEIDFDLSLEKEAILDPPFSLKDLEILLELETEYKRERIHNIEFSLTPMSFMLCEDCRLIFQEFKKIGKVVYCGIVDTPLTVLTKFRNKSLENVLLFKAGKDSKLLYLVIFKGAVKSAHYLSPNEICVGADAVKKLKEFNNANVEAVLIPITDFIKFLPIKGDIFGVPMFQFSDNEVGGDNNGFS